MTSRSTAARQRHSVALSLLLLLGACATGGRPAITPEAYASAQQAFRTDPAARTEAVASCVRARVGEPQVARELMAMLIEVDASEVDQVYCERLIHAVAMGDISHEDYNAIWTGHADAVTSLRVIQALRLGSGPRLTADEFVGLRERLRHDEAYRDDRSRACTVQLEQLWSPVERSSWAADLGVDPEQVVRVYCERLNDAIATGRLGYEGWLALTTAGADPEASRRAIQMLRDEPGERAGVPAFRLHSKPRNYGRVPRKVVAAAMSSDARMQDNYPAGDAVPVWLRPSSRAGQKARVRRPYRSRLSSTSSW